MTSITGNAYLDSLTTTAAAANTAKAKSSGTLDQTSFLKLMTTQLQTQDPTAPVDNSQMVAQMAQFSQVSGIAEMNLSLKDIVAGLQASRTGDASNWIGRSALVASDVAAPLAGRYSGQIALPSDATSVKLSFVNANGTTVHSEELGAQNAGAVTFDWDGKGADGAAVGTGPLKLVVSAAGKDGRVDAATAAWTMVDGVQSPAGGASTRLVTALGLVAPADALRLS